MRDITWIVSKKTGKVNMKALTAKGREVMLSDMDLPLLALSGEVFFMGIELGQLDNVLKRLRQAGLQTHDTTEESVAKAREMTTF